MSALLDEDELALRDAVRSFLDKKVAPLLHLGKALLGHSALSQDATEGVTAFREHRDPVWQDR